MLRRFEVGLLCVAVVAVAGCEIQSVKRGAVVPDPDAKPVTRTLRETANRQAHGARCGRFRQPHGTT
jgi:hypothetical protein